MSNKVSKSPSLILNDFAENPFRFLQNVFSDKDLYWRPRVDLKRNDNEYILTADLPGFDRNDVHVYLKDNMLTIKGEHSSEEKSDTGNYYYHERSCGSFERSIFIPENTVLPDKIDAKLDRGVLTVKIERNPELKKSIHEVEVH